VVTRLLTENGHTVSRLLRRKSKEKLIEALPVEIPPTDAPTIEPLQIVEPSVEPPAEEPIEDAIGEDAEEQIEVAVEEPINADIEVPAREIPKDVRWDSVTNEFDAQAAEGADAVVHLAGASIGGGRWTPVRKALLHSSRVEATRHLVDSLSALNAKPKIFVGVSAVGYYGNRGDEKLTDHSGPGADFLAQICKDWERESSRAADLGARVVILRFGIILSTRGGALPRMLTPIKMFVGGKLGSGRTMPRGSFVSRWKMNLCADQSILSRLIQYEMRISPRRPRKRYIAPQYSLLRRSRCASRSAKWLTDYC